MFDTSSCVITFGGFLDFDGFFDDLRALSGFAWSVSCVMGRKDCYNSEHVLPK
jgi:hypothetical protein